jgi:hypothetical protein
MHRKVHKLGLSAEKYRLRSMVQDGALAASVRLS